MKITARPLILLSNIKRLTIENGLEYINCFWKMNIKLVKQWLRYYPHQYDKQLKSKNITIGVFNNKFT